MRPAAFSFAPQFSTRGAGVVAFDEVRITLSRSGGVAFDTIVPFPSDSDSIRLVLTAPINGASETMTLTLALINAAGDTVFRGGPLPVTLTSGGGSTGGGGVNVPVRYVGVGANAKSVVITPLAASLFFRDSVTLAASALDSSNQPIPGTPIAWRSLDTTIAKVRADTLGRVIAGLTRGVARIEASLPTGQADTAQVTVQPLPAVLDVVSGNGQSGAAGTALAQPLVVKVKGADSLPVQGVVVTWAVTSGGGSLATTTDTTDATGSASTAWTLGGTPGTQSVKATLPATPSIAATLTASVVAGAPKKLAFQVQPSTVASGVAIVPAVQVVAQDSFGNTATSFTGNVTVAIGTNPGSSTLGGTTTVAAVAGVATFSTLTLNIAGTGYTLVAGATGLAGATSGAFNVTAGVPAKVAITTEPSSTAPSGAAFAQQPALQVQDAQGNAVSQSGIVLTAAIASGGGTLGGTPTASTNASGVATFTNLSITGTVGSRTLAFTATGLTGATSTAISITAGAAAKLAVTTEPSATAQSGVAFVQQPVLQLQDASGNAVSLAGDTVTASIASGGGTLGGTLIAITNTSGVATFANLAITGTVGSRTLGFATTGLTGATSTAVNVTAGAAAKLAITTEPSATAQSGVAFAQQPVLQLQDASGNAVGLAGDTVTASIASGGGALGGTLTAVTNGSGVATFANLAITGTVGSRTLGFATTGLTGATSTAISITAGAAAKLAITTEPSSTAQSGVVFAQQPVVQLQDASGNAVSLAGDTVTAGIASGGGTLGGTLTAVTNASGVATFTNLAITGTIGSRTLGFATTGLTGATSTTVNVTAGAAAKLAITTEPSATVQSGVAFAQQPVVQLQDASGNAVSLAGDTVTAGIASGGGTLGGTLTAVTNGSGVATFTNLAITGTVGSRTLGFATTGLSGATSTAISVTAGAATQLAITTQPSAAAQSGVALSPQPVIQLQDASGNAVSQSGIVVTAAIASGGGTLSGTTTETTGAAGTATYTNLTITGLAGPRTLVFTATSLTSVTSGTIVVGAGAPFKLVITTQPSSTAQSGVAFAQQPVVQLEDSSGNAVSQSGIVVTAAIASGGGTLGGTLTATTSASGAASFTNLDITGTVGPRTLTFSASGLTSATSATINVTAGVAAKLAVTTEPSSTAQSGVAFAQQPVLQLQDASGNAVSLAGDTVSASIASGGGTLGGTLTAVTSAGGVATFTNLSITGTVGSRTLGFATTGLTGATSTAVNVTAGAAAKLAVTTEPSITAQSGVAFAQQPALQLQDASGNAVSLAGDTVTASIASGGGSLGGTLIAITNASGVATFTNLAITGTVGSRTLGFATTGLTGATSNAINLTAGTAAKLAITTEPSASAQSGVAFAQQPVIQLQDASGNAVSLAGDTVTASLASGSGTLGGTLIAITNASGAATFSTLAITGTVGTYTVGFATTGLTGTTSTAIGLTAGAAAKLVITTEPSSTAQSGVAFAQQPALQLQDASGNTVSQAGDTVTASIASGGGTLGGTLIAITNASGVATFTNLAITGTVGSRTLGFATTGLTGATSTTVNVTAGAAAKLAVATEPSSTAQSGVAFAQQPVIQVQDASGNAVGVAGDTVTASIASGGGTLGGTLIAITNASGVATFTNLAITGTVGSRTLAFATTGLTGATSTAINVTAGVAAKLAVTTEPSSTAQSGVAFAQQPGIQLQDASGNAVSLAGDTVTASLASGSGTLGVTLIAITNASGVATFTNLTITGTAGAYTLGFATTGLTGATSTSITLSAGAASKLAFTVEPPASSPYQTPFTVTVTAEDSAGNPVTSFSGPVAVAIGTNPAGGTLSGTLSQTAVSGVATFSGLSLDNIGTGYTLVASSTGLSSGTSTAFTIVAPANVNAWISTASGNWSNAANWSKGTVPVATDTVAIKQSGTYTVTVDVAGSFARLDVGAPLGAQTLSVPSATLTIGNGAFSTAGTLSLGGGTITGAGTLTVAGAFNWTGGNLGAVSGAGGTIQVLSGGTLSIAPSVTAQIQGFTLALAGTGTWSTTQIMNSGSGGTIRVLPGGVLTLSGGPSMSFNLQSPAPLFDNQGTVNIAAGASTSTLNVPVTGAGAWNVQTGGLSMQGGGTLTGATAVASGATLAFQNNTFTYGAGSSVTGAGTFGFTAGATTFSGGYSVTGLTQVTGGTATFAAAGQSTGNMALSGGTLSVTGVLTADGVTSWGGTAISISGTGGRLRLAGGSAGSFLGTATVAAGDTLELAGGTFTLTGNLAVTGGGALAVTGGTLVLNGFTAALAGGFATASTGTLTMTNARDSLGVGGNLTFGGGSTAGLLSAGIITLTGNFVQSGNASSYAPTAGGSHRLSLRGTTTQNITMANPSAAQSHFSGLNDVGNGGPVVLQTNAVVTDSFSMQAFASFYSLTGAGTSQRLTLGGAVTLSGATAGPTLAPPVVELSVAPSVSFATFSPDTTVFLGSISALPLGAGIAYKNVRVATSGTFSSPGTIYNGDLIVSSGTYLLNAGSDSVGGFFRTESSGALAMQSAVAVPGLVVRDSAVFAGGPSNNLTSGFITLYGNFVQRGTSGQFAPTGTRVVLQKSTSGVQTIQLADSVNSFFHDLVLNRPSADTIRMLSNVQVQDSAIVTGASILKSTAFEALKLPATGALRAPNTIAVVQPWRAEFGSLTVDSSFTGTAGRFSPDTSVFLAGGSIGSSSPAFAWNSVRLVAGALTSFQTVYNGDLIIQGGTYGMCTGTDSVGGFLRTEGTGGLALSCQEGETIAIRDSAVFAGGTSSVAGTLRIYGDFVQRGSATSFQGSALNANFGIEEFAGSGAQTISFANPDSGSGGSQFGNLLISNTSSAGVTLASKVFALGQLQTADTISARIVHGAANDLSVHGLHAWALTFDNVPLVVDSGAGGITSFANNTWTNMNGAATQFWLRYPAGPSSTFTFNGLTFSQTLTTGGLYVHLTTTGTPSSPPLTVNLTGTTPASSLVTFATQTLLDGILAPVLTWLP